MTSFFRPFGVLLAALTLLGLGACTTTGGLRPQPVAAQAPTVGGDYVVYTRAALPARNGYEAVPAATWTMSQWQDLADLQKSCKAQLEPQIPGIVQEVFLPSGKLAIATGLGGALGTGTGAVTAFTGVSFQQYLQYGGLAAGGSALGSGLATYADRYELAKGYVNYACMQFQVTEVRRFGRLSGIGIGPWAGTGNTRGVPQPAGPPSRGDADEDAAPTAESTEEDPPLVPPL